jgi:lipid-A-disaccharide synthase
VILVDYPGFNLKIAKYVKTELKIPVYYYISPKIWAWKKYRIRSIRRYVDRMFCIFPFEKEFYNRLNYKVEYVGNPVVDAVAAFRDWGIAGQTTNDKHILTSPYPLQRGIGADYPPLEGAGRGFIHHSQMHSEKPILALLAGSRKQEIRKNLPVMIEVALSFPEYQPVIAGAPGLEWDDYERLMNGHEIPVLFGQTYSLLSHSHTALVTSGTATLETALFRVPQVVCYYFWERRLVNFVFRHFFHVPYISLVNLIAGCEVVQELFGANFTTTKVNNELKRILYEPAYRARMLAGYDEIIETLGQSGASQRTASLIVQSFSR